MFIPDKEGSQGDQCFGQDHYEVSQAKRKIRMLNKKGRGYPSSVLSYQSQSLLDQKHGIT